MVQTVVLLSCVKSKRLVRSRADSLYTSALFKKALAYGRNLDPDHIFILSAKHGLLRMDEEIEPYEQTLNRMPVADRRAWAEGVLADLREVVDLEGDRFVILAGQRYRENLLPHLPLAEVPMQGLLFGEQLSWLTERAS